MSHGLKLHASWNSRRIDEWFEDIEFRFVKILESLYEIRILPSFILSLNRHSCRRYQAHYYRHRAYFVVFSFFSVAVRASPIRRVGWR
jgi:hypothetical protein